MTSLNSGRQLIGLRPQCNCLELIVKSNKQIQFVKVNRIASTIDEVVPALQLIFLSES